MMMVKPEMGSSRMASACGDCGAVDRLFIHHVRHRGTFRRLCTSCVLRLHPQSFCPTCFQVYPPAPPNDAVVTCSKCYSSSHSQCIGATPPPNPYICPLCVSPNSPIFKLKTAKEMNLEVGGCWTTDNNDDDCRMMDLESSKILVAAAKIASTSMHRAAAAAKAEAERRAREAAVAKKRVKEALQNVAHQLMKENLRKREGVVVGHQGQGQVPGGFNMSRVNHPSVVVAAERVDRDTSNHHHHHHHQVLAPPALRRRETGMTMMMAAAAESVEELNNHDEFFAHMEVDTKQGDDDDRHEAILDSKDNGNNNYGDQHDVDDDEEEDDDNDDDDDDDDDDNNEDDDAM